MDKIYRNGKNERDATGKTLVVNLGVVGMTLLVAAGFTRWVATWWDGSLIVPGTVAFVVLGGLGLVIYLYLTFIRVTPLAILKGDYLTINSSLFSKKNIDLSKVEKIRFQYSSEHDQRMRVKYKGKPHFELEIKQTNCSVEQLSNFINQKHDIEAREPLNKSKISQRDLERAVARQILRLMAVALSKKFNAANVCSRSRPTELHRFSLAVVDLFWLNPLSLQKVA